MQTNDEAREPNHKHGGAHGAKPVNALGQVSSRPEHETRHPCALQHNCECNQDDSCVEFVCRRHSQVTRMVSREPVEWDAFINDPLCFPPAKCVVISIVMMCGRISGAGSQQFSSDRHDHESICGEVPTFSSLWGNVTEMLRTCVACSSGSGAVWLRADLKATRYNAVQTNTIVMIIHD